MTGLEQELAEARRGTHASCELALTKLPESLLFYAEKSQTVFTASNQQADDLQARLLSSNQQADDLQARLLSSNQQADDLQAQLLSSNQQADDLRQADMFRQESKEVITHLRSEVEKLEMDLQHKVLSGEEINSPNFPLFPPNFPLFPPNFPLFPPNFPPFSPELANREVANKARSSGERHVECLASYSVLFHTLCLSRNRVLYRSCLQLPFPSLLFSCSRVYGGESPGA